MRKDLKKLKQLYDDGVNIIEHMKRCSGFGINTLEMIRISYDLQAGCRIKNEIEYSEWENEYSNVYAETLNQLGCHGSIMEAGTGEGNTLNNILSRIVPVPSKSYGFDISYSKIRYAIDYFKKKDVKNSTLFMADLFNIPVQDNSIDIVYTNHALEPNGGREKEALPELYRVTKKYLVLFEPIYELAGYESKKYMEKHGYVRNLYSTAIGLGYKVIEYKILFESNPRSLNNWGVLIIEKRHVNKAGPLNPFVCPITKAPLELIRNNYYCRDSFLLYPVVEQIPCLLPENAIIATHYLDDAGGVR